MPVGNRRLIHHPSHTWIDTQYLTYFRCAEAACWARSLALARAKSVSRKVNCPREKALEHLCGRRSRSCWHRSIVRLCRNSTMENTTQTTKLLKITRFLDGSNAPANTISAESIKRFSPISQWMSPTMRSLPTRVNSIPRQLIRWKSMLTSP